MKTSRCRGSRRAFAGGLILAVLAVAQAQTYSVSTFAGFAGSRGSTNANGTTARFVDPFGLAVDRDGNVHVADGAGCTIRVITPLGAVNTLAGTPGASGSTDGTGSEARFGSPTGVAVDAVGNLYVADLLNHTIRKITPEGVVTTVAGLAGSPGSADGVGGAARFNRPMSVVVDGTGNLFVADSVNNAVRLITPAGVVSTFAGQAGSVGITNGTGTAARFGTPMGLAIDAAGNLYVSDPSAQTIRKITPAAVVTTLAGTAGAAGSTDGSGTAARFNMPMGLAVDRAGYVYVADNVTGIIRKISPAGVVSTIAGLAGSTGAVDAVGNDARFNRPGGVAVDGGGNVYVADELNYTIRRLVPLSLPVIVTPPQSQTGFVGGNATLAVEGTGGDLRYQWRFNGSDVAGATTSALSLAALQPAQAGSYTVAVTNSLGSVVSSAAVLAVVAPPTVRAQSYTFSTIAGAVRQSGSADGAGASARFGSPYGVTVDPAGNVYVAEYYAHVIRRITPAGVVTTVAGEAGSPGSTDGLGSVARFNRPTALAVDGAGNLLVTDYGNATVRKITPAGVVSTVFGLAGVLGSSDGDARHARFQRPIGIATDTAGNAYVTEWESSVIRKITPAGVVSTLAGLPRAPGYADGAGATARFNGPEGLAVDAAGNLYVADRGNSAIRKVTPAGAVSTLAGLAGSRGSADGFGSNARFQQVVGIAVDPSGNVYVGDAMGNIIRRITPAGEVSTLAGLAGSYGSADGSSLEARFWGANGVALDSAGAIVVADNGNTTIRRGVPDATPVVLPASLTVAPGNPATFSVGGPENGVSYQWRRNGVNLAGATSATWVANAATAADAGAYTVAVTDAGRTAVSTAATLTVANDAARLINLSIRTRADTGANVLTVGFVVGGIGSKQLLVRGIGPALSLFGVPGVLDDPRIEFFDGQASLTRNDDWGGAAPLTAAFSQSGAFALPAGSRDAALTGGFAPKAYTVQLTGAAETSGVALAELYDLDASAAGPRLINLSARCQVGTGAEKLVAGFVIGGAGARTLLIRAIGPTLGLFWVPGILADPMLVVQKQSDGTVLAGCNDWSDAGALRTAFERTGAFALPDGTKDAATIVTLPAGAYTVEVSGVGSTTGIALVEVYELP